MRPGTKRGLLIAGAAVLLATALVYAFWPQPVAVDLAVIGSGPLEVTINEEGRTRVKEVYIVSAPVAGRMLRIDRHVGDEVIAGDTVLATIVPSEPAFLDVRGRAQAEAEVKAADAARTLAVAEVEQARAELEFAEAELERATALAERGNISRSNLDRALLEAKTRRAALARSEAALSVRTAELETANARLIAPRLDGAAGQSGCCVTVKAPVNGRILRIVQESEAVVAAGAPLVELGDPSALEIVAELLSSDAVRVAAGAEVRIEAWGGGETLAGRVRRVEPYGFTKVSALGIEEQRVNVIVEFIDSQERWRQLGHGFRVEVRIVVWRADDVVKVPLGALFRAGDDWAAFVEQDGRARLRRIQIGARNALDAELKEGLALGARVVLHPSDRVADGVRIVARPSS